MNVPVVVPPTRRIVIEQMPTGVVGEESMAIHYEGFPEGWGLVNEVLLKASSQAAWQAVLEERKRHQQKGAPVIMLPGERV